ncbi:MAG: carbohydrate ABC transporter permease [Polyangiales bacterium]
MRERRAAFGFLAPALIALAVVAAYPVLAAVWLSMHREILVFREHRFVGLANWSYLLGDARFWAALGHTTYFVVVAVAIELALGLAFALLVHAKARGRGLVRAALLVPWAVPTVVSAKLWAWLYDPDHGLITHLLHVREVNILGTPVIALHAAIVVDVWKTTPFVALIMLAGLQSIPEQVLQAARVDGASPARTFRSITLPMLLPTVIVAATFRALDAVRVFDAIFVLTDGGPANTTETLSIYAYKTMLRLGDFGYGATLSVATFLVALAIAVVGVGAQRRVTA